MHLTNYSINKSSKDFVRNDDEGGSKRSVLLVFATFFQIFGLGAC